MGTTASWIGPDNKPPTLHTVKQNRNKRILDIPMCIITLIVTWWLANAVTSIASKALMISQSHDHSHDERSVRTALQDLRWIDLTAIQLAVSGILTMAWVKLCRVSTPIAAKETNQKILLLASLANMVGNLATNASYAAINSSTTQVIKACKPVFTFALLLILGRQKHENLKCSVLFSLLVMSTGTCVFVAWDSSFNIWGIVAALVSNFAYSLRNICIKSLSRSWDNPIHQYSTISLYSLLFIFPIVMTKLLTTKNMLVFNLEEFLTLTGSFLTYNIASIHVLQTISPLHHAMLSLFKRIFVIIINILYFSTSVDFLAAVGFVVLVVGLLLYYKTYHHLSLISTFCSLPKLISCTVTLSTVVYLLFFTHLPATVTRVPFSQLYSSDDMNSYDVNLYDSVVTNQNIITSSWVYAKPLPESVLRNINTWTNTLPKTTVHVFCGNFQSVKAFTDLKRHDITASFLVINKLVQNTTFEDWFTRHPLNKVLEGVNFEDHLQQVVSLVFIWRYGGTYIDPRVKIYKTQYNLDTKQPLIFLPSNDTRHDILGLFNFPKEHSFIRVIGQAFVDKYTKDIKDTTSWPMAFNFREIILEACRRQNKLCPRIIQLQYSNLSESDSSETINSFGTLSYDNRVRIAAVANLGDEIQGFPGLQFVPFVKEFLESGELHQWKTERNMTCFFNTLWDSPYTNFNSTPSPNTDPIMLSMHIGDAVKPMMSKNIEYLRKKSPIGCRDTNTLEFLRKQGVEAFFSGSLTLLMKNPMKMNKRTENIYLADVSHEVRKLLPLEIQQKGILVEHNMNGDARYDKYARFKAAYGLIEKYSTAKLVVTQSIHSALPCVAMGTPVIFINSPAIPGGDGRKTESLPETQGFDELFYSVDLYKLSPDEAKKWLRSFDWTNPRPAPQVSLLKRLRATSWNVIRKKKPLYETAFKFGIIPFQSFIHSERTKQKLFHLIFTTKSTGFINLFSNSAKVPSSFSWRHWRCIESIFYFHPFAKVIVHSNTLPHSFFDVLKESGYDIEIWRYNLAEIVRGTPAESFMIKRYREVKNGQFWYSHETDLLRMVILYRYGGVYMDTDVIIARSIEELSINVVGYQTDGKMINGAFMYIQKKHPFTKECLERFAKNYDPNNWPANGPVLITNLLHENKTGFNIKVLPQHAFYMFEYESVIDECFQQTSGKNFEDNMKTLKEKAFVVHLYSKYSAAQGTHEKLKEGTICKHLLNSFCVLCDQRY